MLYNLIWYISPVNFLEYHFWSPIFQQKILSKKFMFVLGVLDLFWKRSFKSASNLGLEFGYFFRMLNLNKNPVCKKSRFALEVTRLIHSNEKKHTRNSNERNALFCRALRVLEWLKKLLQANTNGFILKIKEKNNQFKSWRKSNKLKPCWQN